MSPTAKQMLDEYVSCCVQTWQSNGTSMTLMESITKNAQFDTEGRVQLGPGPGGAALSIQNLKSYLWTPFDDSPPIGKLGDKLGTWRRTLDQFTSGNPSLISDMDALLDEQINSLGLVNEVVGSKPQSQLSRNDKIKLLAQYWLVIKEEPQPQPLGSATPAETKLYLLRINWQEKFIVEEYSFPCVLSYENFVAWLEKVAEPFGLSWALHDSLAISQELAQDATDEDALEALKYWHEKDKLSEKELATWSYTVSKTTGPQTKLIGNDENWFTFENAKQFEDLLGRNKDPQFRPVFMRMHLLKEARELQGRNQPHPLTNSNPVIPPLLSPTLPAMIMEELPKYKASCAAKTDHPEDSSDDSSQTEAMEPLSESPINTGFAAQHDKGVPVKPGRQAREKRITFLED